MGKKNKGKKNSEQQGSAQGSQQRTTQSNRATHQPAQQSAAQSNGAARSAPVQQAPQTQSAWTTVAGRNASAQQPPQQRTAQSNGAARSAPVQQAPQTQSAWVTAAGRNASAQQPPQQRTTWPNAPAQQAPQTQSAWTTVAGRNSPAQQAAPPQRSAWGNGPPQNAAPAQQAPQQSTGWPNVARRNSPAQQPPAQQAAPPQRSAWGNGPAQNASPAQQAPQQRAAGPNGATQHSSPQQPPQQRSAWGNAAGQTGAAQQRSAWGNAPAQIAPVEQALAQLAITEQAPVQQPAAEQAAAQQTVVEQASGGDAPAQKETRNRRRLEDEIATRPTTCKTKHGKAGVQVQLQANYFEVLNRADWCLYQYRVDISPNEERTSVKKALLRTHARELGSYLFDGTMLFCSNRLRNDYMELQSMSDDRTPILITIKLTGDLAKGDHHYLQLFNILVRRCLEHLNLELVGRNYFDMTARSEIRGHKLELWPGYITSIRQHDRGVLMCAEVSHKVMRIDTVYAVLHDLIEKEGQRYREKFEDAILGTVVLTTYNNRTYRVDDVDWKASPNTTFKKGTEDIRFADYYQTKYQITIADRKQPLLVSRMSQRQRRAGENEMVYLIPELCRSTGLTDKMRLDFALMKALAMHTKLSPNARITKLLNFNRRLSGCPNVVTAFNEWDFQLKDKLVQLKGRVLTCPGIITGQNTLKDTTDWNYKMQKQRFYKARPLRDWAIIIPSSSANAAMPFIRTMIEAARRMSFEMSEPRQIILAVDRPDNYVNEIENITKKYNLQLIMCVMSSNHATKYCAIKKKVCVDRPIPNQVVLARTLYAKTESMFFTVTSKIAMQMGCKIGCVPWTVQLNDLTSLNIMSVGFDVCHDTTRPGSDFGAMVASIDPSHGIYYSSVSAHRSGEELSNDLALQLKGACNAYVKRNRDLPQAIIIYRDGVGEGQVPFVYNYEVKRIVETLSAYYKNLKRTLRLSFVIVTKRINTRLFNGSANPDPGTVVDDVITDPLKYDFFLVSQIAREGTVSPTSYNVIFDNTGLTPDTMQQLTYKLCYMYYNFTGPVRVPAPCQFAHKLAFFVSQAVKQKPSQTLSELLYFI